LVLQGDDMRDRIAFCLVAVLCGCNDDVRPLAARWEETSQDWGRKLAALKADQIEQTKRMTDFTNAPGLNPDGPVAKGAASLQTSSENDQLALEVLSTAVARHLAAVPEALAKRKRDAAVRAIDAANAEVVPLLARVTESAEVRRLEVKSLGVAVNQELEDTREAQRWDAAAVERAPLELTNIRFLEGTAELEAPENQRELEKLIAWANGCPSLSFSLTGHTSRELEAKEALALTENRVATVKKFLIDHGVPARKIVTAAGAGWSTPVVEEPEPGTSAALEMRPAALEALRAKNRRITVQTVSTCKVG
jgi:outer membrane protein OmpA-like peptidoglycan-associated protein